MDKLIQTNLKNMHSEDRQIQHQAFQFLLQVTDQPVDWVYEAWDGLLSDLAHKDNHVRAIAAQLLCNLAKSDPQKRILKDFSRLLAVTRDPRFVTARHTLQALWKVGSAGAEQQATWLGGLEGRFIECISEKNCTLIRYDILQSMRNVYDEVKDESIRAKALQLIESEEDLKYRKKYAGLWRSS